MKILLLARSTLFTQPGGDSLQIEETAKELRQLGCEVDIATSHNASRINEYDVVHFFNLFRPADILPHLRKIKKLVVTTVYIDYSEYDRHYRGQGWNLVYNVAGKFGVEFLKTKMRWLKGKERFPGFFYLFRGQKAAIAKVLKKADCLITASDYEARHIRSDFPEANALSYAKIPLGSEHLQSSPAREQRVGIACIGRIEGLKNQLNLIKAVGEKHPLHLYGQAAAHQQKYLEACRSVATENVIFKGQQSRDDIRRALVQTKVHALPSFFETTGLATIEALKAGCEVVVSDRGAMKEIYGSHAFYCDPSSTESIGEAIEKAMHAKGDHRKWVKENFSWSRAAREILDLYQSLYSKL